MAEMVAQLTGAEEIHWDLTDFYKDMDDPAIDRDLDEADARADKLAEEYRGRVASLDAEEMRHLIEELEATYELSFKAGNFAQLHWTTNTEDPLRGGLMQKVNERGTRLGQKLLFLGLEWAEAPADKAEALMAHPVLEHYRHWLAIARLYKPYNLTEAEEKILAEKSITGRDAWIRFYDELQGAARFDLDGEKVPLSIAISKLRETDRELRKRAAKAISEGLQETIRIRTFVFNNILADKASDDQLRGYPSWITNRNMSNQVDDESVNALIKAVSARFDIVHRFYRLKRRLLGVDELFHYDRIAPLPTSNRFYSWEQAKEMVLNAFNTFDPRMVEITKLFFDKNWIDAAVTPGKDGGAFSAPAIPSVHPYILMNYRGKPDDVMTLAHELGHGVHQYLAKDQGLLLQDTPLTAAETASVFGEMLVFQDLLAQESDPEARLALLTSKIEDSFNTIFRQIAFNLFEEKIHTERRTKGELTTERFNEIWMETQGMMFGDSMTFTDEYGVWWSYIHHMVRYPGYVYAYAFGNLLVLALYAKYQEAPEGFADKYMQMLAAGGSNYPHEIVKPLGVDLQDPNFWKQGLQTLENMVAEAEELSAQLGK